MDLVVTSVNLGLYLGFYTAYSKATKKLEFPLLWDVLLGRKGLDHTLVELNKAISLAGLTNLPLAMLLGSYGLVWHAMLLLWTHSCYSAFKFYGSTHIPRVTTWNTNPITDFLSSDSKVKVSAQKKFALVCGSAGQLLLAFTSLPVITMFASLAHFYVIELDYKLNLKVRPYAYLPFPLIAAAAVYYFLF